MTTKYRGITQGCSRSYLYLCTFIINSALSQSAHGLSRQQQRGREHEEKEL